MEDTNSDNIPGNSEAALAADALEVSVEELSGVRRKVNVTVPESRIKNKYESVMNLLIKDAALPGFRKGRVPRRLLEKRFKADIRNDVRSQIVSESMTEVLETKKLQPLSEPKLIPESPEVPETGAMQFAVEFEVLPEFSLPDLSAVELKKPVLTVTEERMNLAREHLRGNLAEMREIPEVGEAEDHITLDIKLLDAAGAVLEHLPQQHYHFAQEYNLLGIRMEGLENHLRGAKVGGNVKIDVTLPDNFKREDLRGQKAVVEIQIDKIMRRVRPELTEELAKANGFDGLKDLEESLRKAIEDRLKLETGRLLREQVAEKLREIITIEVPPSLLNNTTAKLAQNIMRQGVADGQQPQLTPEMVEHLRSAAEPLAKVDAIVLRLADRLGVEVQSDEVHAEVATLADMNGLRPETLLNRMAKTGQLDALRFELLQRKVLDSTVAQCKIVEVDEAQWKREQEELRATMANTQATPDAGTVPPAPQ